MFINRRMHSLSYSFTGIDTSESSVYRYIYVHTHAKIVLKNPLYYH